MCNSCSCHELLLNAPAKCAMQLLSKPKQTQSKPQIHRRPLWLRVLYHPMVYVSLLLHGLIFAIPGNPEPEIPPELEEEEQDIQITMLPPVIEPEPEIDLEELPEPEPEPTPPPPQAVTQPQPAPEPVAPPQEQAPPATPEPEPPPTSQHNAAVNPETTFDPEPFRSAFSANSLEGYVPIPVTPDSAIWEDPAPFYTQDANGETILRPGVLADPALLNNIRVTNISSEESGNESVDDTLTGKRVYLGASFAEGITVERRGEYAGGPLFEVLSEEGQSIMFLNFVPGSGGASSIMIRWAYDPNSPPNEATGGHTP